MIMDFILFLLTVHGKKIAKSCYSVHSSMRASNIISPEGKVKDSLSGYLFKVRAQEVANSIFLSLRFHDIAKYILEFLLRNLIKRVHQLVHFFRVKEIFSCHAGNDCIE